MSFFFEVAVEFGGAFAGYAERFPLGRTQVFGEEYDLADVVGVMRKLAVDGLDNREHQDSGTTLEYSLEGVEEFKIQTSGFSAEYGKAPVTIVLATKSGTNQVRGSLFAYGRNEAMTTTDYFSKPENGGLGKQPFKRFQVGGSGGGPIIKDRAWYFGSIERVQQDFTLPRPANLLRELQVLEACLRALPAFIGKHSTTEPAVEEVIVPVAGGQLAMTLSWMTEGTREL